MESGSIKSALRQIRTLYTVGTLGGLSDAQLLELFLARNGDDAEDAFAALVHRHGPTVLGVCRRMLPSSHDCEDAFQATFLVLARRAASIGRRERLASWLYGVAVRTAKEARRRAAQQRAGERRLMDLSRVESEPDGRPGRSARVPGRGVESPARALSGRAGRLRAGREIAARGRGAARHPRGHALHSPGAGRKLLRERLLRRGVSLGVGPIAGLSRPIAEAAVPERLMGRRSGPPWTMRRRRRSRDGPGGGRNAWRKGCSR